MCVTVVVIVYNCIDKSHCFALSYCTSPSKHFIFVAHVIMSINFTKKILLIYFLHLKPSPIDACSL